MSSRYADALAFCDENKSVAEIAKAISDNQRTLFDQRLGSNDVCADPVSRLLTCKLVEVTGNRSMNESMTEYDNITKQCEAQVDASGPRRFQSGLDSQNAVNVGALANSITRYSAEVAAENGAPESDPAIKLIVHQISFLCKAGARVEDEHDARAACRAAVAKQVIAEVADQPACATPIK